MSIDELEANYERADTGRQLRRPRCGTCHCSDALDGSRRQRPALFHDPEAPGTSARRGRYMEADAIALAVVPDRWRLHGPCHCETGHSGIHRSRIWVRGDRCPRRGRTSSRSSNKARRGGRESQSCSAHSGVDAEIRRGDQGDWHNVAMELTFLADLVCRRLDELDDNVLTRSSKKPRSRIRVGGDSCFARSLATARLGEGLAESRGS